MSLRPKFFDILATLVCSVKMRISLIMLSLLILEFVDLTDFVPCNFDTICTFVAFPILYFAAVSQLYKSAILIYFIIKFYHLIFLNMGLWDSLLNWIRSLFFKQEMELSLVGLQNAGKTSLVNVVATGGYTEDMILAVGFNMRKVTKGNVTIKLWDLGGQCRFRTMWERYCRGVSAIVYVVDAANRDGIPITRSELHDLSKKSSLEAIPLLVLGKKIDKS